MFDNTYRMNRREITATPEQYRKSWLLLANLEPIPDNKLLPLYVHAHTRDGELKPRTVTKAISHQIDLNERRFLPGPIRRELRDEVRILIHVCKNRQIYEVLKMRKHIPEGMTEAAMLSRISYIRIRYRGRMV